MQTAIQTKLMAYVEPEPNTGCWLWSGYGNRRGYGFFTLKGIRLAHRAAYTLFVGAIPTGLFVCHRCDVPSCVNPDHLFLGTARDNNRDMIAKGRDRCFTKRDVCKHGHALTPDNLVTRTDSIRECLTCHREHGRRYDQRKRDRHNGIQSEQPAVLTIHGGRGSSHVIVIGETAERYWIRSDRRVPLAGYSKWLEVGKRACVPKHLISFSIAQGA